MRLYDFSSFLLHLIMTKYLFWFYLCRDELKQVVTSDLQRLLGIEGEPAFVKYVEFGDFFI